MHLILLFLFIAFCIGCLQFIVCASAIIGKIIFKYILPIGLVIAGIMYLAGNL